MKRPIVFACATLLCSIGTYVMGSMETTEKFSEELEYEEWSGFSWDDRGNPSWKEKKEPFVHRSKQDKEIGIKKHNKPKKRQPAHSGSKPWKTITKKKNKKQMSPWVQVLKGA